MPHHLLNRAGALTSSEFEVMRQHPLESTRLLRKMGYDDEARLNLVLYSHENFAGGGYPGKLKGAEIPIGSRIIAVVDAYDALTSKRPYRDSWDRHAALDEIRRSVEKGVYDPQVVAALLKMLS